MGSKKLRIKPLTLGHAGLSLAEVVVGMGVASLLSLTMAQMMASLSKQARVVATSGDFERIKGGIELCLTNTAHCQPALLQSDGTPARFPLTPFAVTSPAISVNLDHMTSHGTLVLAKVG